MVFWHICFRYQFFDIASQPKNLPERMYELRAYKHTYMNMCKIILAFDLPYSDTVRTGLNKQVKGSKFSSCSCVFCVNTISGYNLWSSNRWEVRGEKVLFYWFRLKNGQRKWSRTIVKKRNGRLYYFDPNIQHHSMERRWIAVMVCT